jgi:hypothetical protein
MVGLNHGASIEGCQVGYSQSVGLVEGMVVGTKVGIKVGVRVGI